MVVSLGWVMSGVIIKLMWVISNLILMKVVCLF